MKFLYFYIFCSFGLKHGPRTISCVLRAPAEDRALLGEEKLWGNFSSLCRLLSFVVPEVHGCPLMKSFFVAR